MKRIGCIWTCLIVVVVVLVVVVGGGYIALFHTSLPLKAIASAISQDGKVKIEGVSGTISSGFHVDRVEIKDTHRPPSEIEDISLRYHGGGWGQGDAVVIEEAKVGKATVYINIEPSVPAGEQPAETEEGQQADQDNAPPHRDESNQSELPKNFRIDRVSLNDLVIKDPEHDFELTIPKIEWTGFKIEEGKVDPGILTVESDRLDIKTLPGTAEKDDDAEISLQRRLVGTLKPKLHRFLREAISFEADVALDPKGNATVLAHACDGRLKLLVKNQSGHLLCENLDVAHYVNGIPYDMPTDVNLDVTTTADAAKQQATVHLHGKFRLAASDFEIAPQEFLLDKQTAVPINIKATSTQGDATIIYELTIGGDKPFLKPRLSAEPELPANEILARLLFGRPIADLSPEEAAHVEEKVGVYFPTK